MQPTVCHKQQTKTTIIKRSTIVIKKHPQLIKTTKNLSNKSQTQTVS